MFALRANIHHDQKILYRCGSKELHPFSWRMFALRANIRHEKKTQVPLCRRPYTARIAMA